MAHPTCKGQEGCVCRCAVTGPADPCAPPSLAATRENPSKILSHLPPVNTWRLTTMLRCVDARVGVACCAGQLRCSSPRGCSCSQPRCRTSWRGQHDALAPVSTPSAPGCCRGTRAGALLATHAAACWAVPACVVSLPVLLAVMRSCTAHPHASRLAPHARAQVCWRGDAHHGRRHLRRVLHRRLLGACSVAG